MTVSVKSFSTAGGVALIVLLASSYFLLPWLGIRFYQGRNVRGTFEAHDQRPSALEARWRATLPFAPPTFYFILGDRPSPVIDFDRLATERDLFGAEASP